MSIDDFEIPAELAVGSCEACGEPKLRDELAHSYHPLGSGTPECLSGALPDAYFIPAENEDQRAVLAAAMNENYRTVMARGGV